MLDLRKWQASYSVGNWVLDNQHKVLLGLCADALELVPEGTGEQPNERFRYAQEDLLACIEDHFETEERLLKQFSRAAYEHHHAEHVQFWNLLSGKLREVNNGEIDRHDLHTFLVNWWSNHIFQSDRAFSHLIQRAPNKTALS